MDISGLRGDDAVDTRTRTPNVSTGGIGGTGGGGGDAGGGGGGGGGGSLGTHRGSIEARMATIRASANAPGSDTALRKQMGELQAKGAKAKRKFDMDTLARVEAELYVVVLGGNQYICNWFYEVNLPLDRVFVCLLLYPPPSISSVCIKTHITHVLLPTF